MTFLVLPSSRRKPGSMNTAVRERTPAFGAPFFNIEIMDPGLRRDDVVVIQNA